MKKLINGIVEFRQKAQGGYRERYAHLAARQTPDVLFFACSDSRVVPNTFASTNPGDLFVVRNVANLIPPCNEQGVSKSDESEPAAIEFALLNLNVRDIVICGHSECGGMRALYENRRKIESQNLRSWLRHGDKSLKNLNSGLIPDTSLTPLNQLSQINVLVQIENLKSYPVVRERLERGELRIHGWWFDITHADVYCYDPELNKFIIIDESGAERLMSRLK